MYRTVEPGGSQGTWFARSVTVPDLTGPDDDVAGATSTGTDIQPATEHPTEPLPTESPGEPSAPRRIELPGEPHVAPRGPVEHRAPASPFGSNRDLNDRLVWDLIEAVKAVLRREASDRLRDIYMIGDIEKDPARNVIERMRELANDDNRPITLYINSAGGNVTDGLAMHDSIRQIVRRGIEVTIVVQGMAYSMASIVLQAASPGRRLAQPHSWIMIHEPAKWAGWQSTSAAAQHLDRLKQMQAQIYEILSARSGRPLNKIIRDTKRTDFYLDAAKALEYGLIDGIADS
jgi:ATP-dependent Clp protease, protease subunit